MAVRVRIAVLTYRRLRDISTLLPQLVQQARAASDDGSVAEAVDVVVVDNDPDASARETVEQIAGGVPEVRVQYEHEAVPGISAARNRALTSAAEHDLLVFIDDDERPSDQWLEALLHSELRSRP